MKKLILALATTIILVIGSFLLIWNHFDYKPPLREEKNFIIVKTYKKKGYPFPMAFDKGTSIGEIAKTMFGVSDSVKYKQPPNKIWQLIENTDNKFNTSSIYEDIIIQNVT